MIARLRQMRTKQENTVYSLTQRIERLKDELGPESKYLGQLHTRLRESKENVQALTWAIEELEKK